MMTEQTLRERECVHRGDGAAGEFYQGTTYVQLLQRLPVVTATRFATRVASFFWSDAAQIKVWLCHDCAAELQGHASKRDA
ncbi:MAG: hypothetical protein DMF64_16200 [Acidobacteria bacterium]|nr:MAG: hypothetical protein DMF64_16200 [Acidobacteriota bacterium]